MKHLTDYTQSGMTAIFEKYGAFFAFSDKQFNEQKKEGVEYVQTEAGMICPKEHVKTVLSDIENNYRNGIQSDIAENGTRAIIQRELMNHEYGYTFDLNDTVQALVDYPVTAKEIREVANSIDWSGY